MDAKVRQHLQLNGAQVSEDCKITVGTYGDAKHFVADLDIKVKGKIWVRKIDQSYVTVTIIMPLVYEVYTVMILSFRTPKTFVVITLKFGLCDFTID